MSGIEEIKAALAGGEIYAPPLLWRRRRACEDRDLVLGGRWRRRTICLIGIDGADSGGGGFGRKVVGSEDSGVGRRCRRRQEGAVGDWRRGEL